MAYRRRANCRFVPTVVKIANADCVCSGAQRAPCRLAMITAQIQRRKASRFVIARSEATWQSRSIRPDHRALPANTVTLRGIALRTPPSTRRVRSAIIPPNLGPARRSGNAATPHTLAFAILTAAGTGRRCLPEIATGAKRPRNDKSDAIAVLTVVCTNRQHIAGSHAKSAPRGRGAQVFSVSALDVGEVAHGLLYGAEVGKRAGELLDDAL